MNNSVPSRRTLLLAAGAAGALLLMVTVFLTGVSGKNRTQSLSPFLLSPAPLLQDLAKSGRPVFVSPEFLPLVPKDNRKNLFPSGADSLAGSENPGDFLKRNRSVRFSSALIGARTPYLPLVNSLLASRLWVLAEVSPWGYLFRPLGSHEWSLPSPEEIAGKWPLPADRSDWMIRTAHALIVMGRYNDANRLLIEGEKMKLDPSILLGTKASLAASLGEWENAASLSRKALRVDGSNGAAREILIRSLVECGRSQEALGMARKDFGKDDRNEEHLFLLARVANSAGSRDEEIDALRRLVDLQRSRKVPAFTALAYLGQAEAKDGLRGEAMRAFEEILSTPDLPEEQHNAVRSMIDHLSFEKPLPPIGRQFPPDIPDARGSPSPSNP